MSLVIKIRSARSVEVEGKDVIDEISYQYSDSSVGVEVIDTAMKLPSDGIDIDGDGFVDKPTVDNLVEFVVAVNESLPGAEGCANAHLTLIKQLSDKNKPKTAEVEVSDYQVDGVGIDEEDAE